MPGGAYQGQQADLGHKQAVADGTRFGRAAE
jgi:hypothetical protein